jgi:type II secretory pathway component GspD/PulD (secretin)
MSSVVRVWSGVALLVAVLLVPVAAAENEQLQAAANLFEKQEYVAAQEALLKVERESLSDAERGKLDELLKVVPEAIKASEKAAQDLASANAAYDEGKWEVAERLYRAVEGNKYALASARDHAAAQGERIAEKKKLADAAKPTGTVESTVVTETTEAKPVERPRAEANNVPPPAAVPAPPPAEAPVEGPRRLTPTDELRIRDELLWQRAVAQAEAAGAMARAAVVDKDFVKAREQVATALQTIEAAAHYAAPVAKYQVAKDAVLALQQEVEQAQAEYDRQKVHEEQAEIAQRIIDRADLITRQKTEKIQQLFNSVDQLRREHRYTEAAEVLREVLRIDPSNAMARYQLDWAEDAESIDQQANWQHDVNVQQRQALTNAEEAIIPWDVDVMYPRNWLELTALRAKQGIATGHDVGDVELNKQLGASLPDVRFEETAFEQVMDFLGEMTKVNISVDWTDLADNGVERDKPVTVRLSNVTFRTVLNEVLSQAGGDVHLAFAVGDGLLRIATKQKLDRNKLVLIYDIRDLLVNVPQATRQAAFDVTQGMGQGGTSGGGGGGGGGMFGGQGGGMQQGGDQYGGQNGQQPGQLAQQVIDIIRQTVEPDSWRETGGGDGSIRDLNGQLIIYNTSDAHRQVVDLLGQLRETRTLQISVESRFLDVISNFLEQFGVDLDFVFNSGSAGYDQAAGLTDPATGAVILIPRQYSRIGSTPVAPAFGQPLTQGTVPQQPYNQPGFVPSATGVIPQINTMTPISVQQQSMSLVDPTTINTNVPGSWAQRGGLAPAMNIGGSFLNNLQVDFLIRATQANSRSSIVQAPRLVIFNGQASRISVGRSRTYVGSLEARVAEGVAVGQPVLAQADSGVSMRVEGTISADRRYVTLSMQVQQREEPSFERFEVQRASGNSPGLFISLPDQGFATLETTVSVPDGGTVLLGGLKQVGEVELEAGVPILSKIPVLKRAFTNQTTVKDTRTLLILVKSKIIIQKEAEDEAFPTFSRPGP